jgi:hypothetical protein
MAMEPNYLIKIKKQWDTIPKIFINENEKKFVLFEEWLEGEEPYTLKDEYNMIVKKIKD